MSRTLYDSSDYYKEKAKLPKPDGIHCIICGTKFDKPNKHRYYCSKTCFGTWFYTFTKSWAVIRNQVLRRDGKCMQCGITFDTPDIKFEVHHIKPIKEGGSEFDLDNCTTLCRNCHKRIHNNKYHYNKTLDNYID